MKFNIRIEELLKLVAIRERVLSITPDMHKLRRRNALFSLAEGNLLPKHYNILLAPPILLRPLDWIEQPTPIQCVNISVASVKWISLQTLQSTYPQPRY